MAKTDDKTPRGNLIGFLNSAKQPGDSKPVFQGKLSLPGSPSERGFALWAYTSEKSGDTVLSGRATNAATEQVKDLIHAKPDKTADTIISIAQKDGGKGLEIAPHALLLFSNKQKDKEGADSEKVRPDYWGYYNPGNGEALQRIAAWAKTDRNGAAMLTGSLQKEEPFRGNERSRNGQPAREPEEEREEEMEMGR